MMDDVAESKGCPHSVDCMWTSNQEKHNFMSLLHEEAFLREINCIGKSLEQLRSELKEELQRELKLK